MTLKQFAIVTGGLLILMICSIGIVIFLKKGESSSVGLQPDTQQAVITIAAFGDSLTAGYGVDLTESYPYVLEERLKSKGISVNIINMGVSGETSQGGLERTAFVLEQNPDVILLGLGANDMLRSLPPSFIKNNLEKIITDLLQGNKKVVLLGMKSSITNGATYRGEFDSIYKDLADKYNLPLVPFFLEGVALRPSLNIDDGIHPNKAGYEKIVDENIIPVILPLIKKL